MNILFINPPIWNLQATHYRINRPLGAPILCSILNQAGHQASFIDAECLKWSEGHVKGLVNNYEFDAIGMTVLYHNRQGAIDLAQKLRILWKGSKVWDKTELWAGGPYATTNPLDLLKNGFDKVCVGEGESVILEMLDSKERIFQGVPVKDLDAVPIPDYDMCSPGFRSYQGNLPRFEWPEAVSMWTRGCGFPCVFCSNPVYSCGRPRLMSPARVGAELIELKKRGIKHIFVYSDELVGGGPAENRWLASVCQEIAPLGLTYKTQGRCNPRNELDTLQAMKEAGFKAVMWGCESLSPKVLKDLKKGITPESIWRTLETSKKAGLQNFLFFMVGGIGEEAEDFEMTRRGLAEMKLAGLADWVGVSVMTAEPGSALWPIAQEQGWTKQETGRSHFEPMFSYPWADAKELARRKAVLDRL